MRITAKAIYACMALVELAVRQKRSEPIRAAEIATANEIPKRFLVQILLQLKSAGYVMSVRGASGGYRLSISPEKIRVWDVIALIDGHSEEDPETTTSTNSQVGQILQKVWLKAHQAHQSVLKEVLISQLAEQTEDLEGRMFYI